MGISTSHDISSFSLSNLELAVTPRKIHPPPSTAREIITEPLPAYTGAAQPSSPLRSHRPRERDQDPAPAALDEAGGLSRCCLWTSFTSLVIIVAVGTVFVYVPMRYATPIHG